jgi:glutathione S-transferase
VSIDVTDHSVTAPFSEANVALSGAMLTVIGSFVSPYVRKVLACLELKGIDYQVDPITPFFGNDDFSRLSPLRRIPVLIDGDFHASDSSVICAYLDEAYGGYALLPTDPRDRARARWLEEYADSRLGDLFIWGLFYQKFVRRMVWQEEADEARVRKVLNEDAPAALDYLAICSARSASPTSPSPVSSSMPVTSVTQSTASGGRRSPASPVMCSASRCFASCWASRPSR